MAEDLADLGPDRTLLLVDDDEPFVKRLAKAMEKRGFIPETAESVAAGKAIALTRQYDNPIFLWTQKLRERIGWQKAVVALATKNARILWAVMTREKRYDAHHVSSIPLPMTVAEQALPSTT